MTFNIKNLKKIPCQCKAEVIFGDISQEKNHVWNFVNNPFFKNSFKHKLYAANMRSHTSVGILCNILFKD